jgi:hypothetical protein
MTGRQLCYMFSVALITSEEKLHYENNWFKFSEEKAREHINMLQECMPIMGLHSWPHSVIEFGEAIRYQVAKDDLHELRFKKWKGCY